MLAPEALFVINQTKLMQGAKLMPVAVVINLHTGDAVYIPKTEVSFNEDVTGLRKWVQMRMTFNMLEAQYHESITHLGFTHMLMDGVSVCMHRTLSDRHPIYKLLLPHFQYMHAINKTARESLLQKGGYVEKDMYIGRISMLKLISRHNRNWKYNPIQMSFQDREVMEIPGYFFRDDALLLERAIRTFVNKYVTHYYNNDATVVGDEEIQQFRAQLVLGRAMNEPNGCGIIGIPQFSNIENLVDVLTHFIYICSVEHSATNFPQYEQYAFPPNFAAVLHGQPEQVMNLDDCMPTRRETFSTIKIMKVLTLSLTNSLGNYDSKYLTAMDDAGKNLVNQFKHNLAEIQDQINDRNANIAQGNNEYLHEYPYKWLLPKNVLNSISI